MGIIGLIATRNFIPVNKDLIKAFGLEEAIILGELASEYNYFEQKGEISEDGYFYSTADNVEENTTLKEKRQRNALNNLKEKGIIDVKLKGIPAKRYIKINGEKLLPILLNNNGENGETSFAKMAELEQPNPPTNKNKEITIIKEIINCLNTATSSNYRYQSKATQRLINARLNEGFTVDDFKAVIDKKTKEWKGTEMAQYLRPETLFGTKFESYLNAPKTSRKTAQTGFDERTYTKEELNNVITPISELANIEW